MGEVQRRVSKGQDDWILRVLYIITSLLCLYMVFWILIFPASSFQESSEWRRVLFAKVNPPGGVTPPDIVTKYQHQPLVQLTHILPGALWAALIPLQLHPTVRSKYRTLHRYTGYVFIATTLAMSIGVAVILYKRLTFEDYFAALEEDTGTNASAAAGTKLYLLFATLYFAGTALVALRAAMQRRFLDHQRAMLRHIGSGLWIAIQRFLLVGVIGPLVGQGVPPAHQRLYFVGSAYIGTILSLGAAELAIHRLAALQRKGKVQ